MPSINALPGGQSAPAGARGGGENSRISRAAQVLGLMTALSRAAGLARDVAISAVFGTSAAADAFFVAFRIPNLMRRVVAEGAASAAFVPVFVESLAREGEQGAARAAGAVGGASVLLLSLLTAVFMAWAEPLTRLFAPGFSRDPEKLALTVALTRWTFPYLLLVGTAAWAMGVHHTFRRFALPALGPVLMNVAIIVAALGLAPWLEQPAWALVAGVLAGGSAQVAVQLPSLRRLGIAPAMLLAIGHPAVRRCGRLMLSVLVGGSVYQLGVMLSTLFASLLPPGTVSYLWYADRVFEFPLGVVAVAVGTAALPSLSAQAAADRIDAMGETVAHAISLTVALCLPAAVGLLLLSDDITALLFQRGSFSAHDSAMTAWALRASVPGLLGVGLVRVLTSAFFALGMARIPVLAGVLALVVDALLSIALMGPAEPGQTWWGAQLLAEISAVLSIADLRHAGLSLATGLAATVNALLLLVLLRRELPAMQLLPVARSVLRHLLAAAAMTVVVLGWKGLAGAWQFPGALAAGVLGAVAIGSASYLMVAALAGSDEIRELLQLRPAAAGVTKT